MKKIVINSDNENIKLPYILVIPDNYSKDARLIVELEGNPPTDKSITEQIDKFIEQNTGNSMDYMLHLLVKELNFPVIMPIIPRLKNFYTTYLGSKVIKNDFTGCDISSEEQKMMSNIDLQVKYMIEEAAEELGISKRAIVKGYSATAKFATQFSILHPEVIEINLSGGISGLATLPVASYENIVLPYPIGVSDIPNFNFEEYKKIKHFFYIGNEDYNNPALPKCEMTDEEDASGNKEPKKDENGNYIFILDTDGLLLPTYDECYSKEQINVIHNFYGDDNQIRFKKNEKIYHELNIDSIHKTYPGNHVTLFKNREIIVNDMINIIRERCKASVYDKVYHGSSTGGIKVLEPRVKTHLKEYVYASGNPVIALIFATKHNGDLDFDLSIKSGKVFFTERREGAFDKYSTPGYLYTIKGDNFKHVDNLWEGEVVSETEEEVESCEYIENILDKLYEYANNNLIIINRYPNKPPFIPQDDSDLVDKYIGFEKMGHKGAVDSLINYFPSLKEKVFAKLEMPNEFYVASKEVDKFDTTVAYDTILFALANIDESAFVRDNGWLNYKIVDSKFVFEKGGFNKSGDFYIYSLNGTIERLSMHSFKITDVQIVSKEKLDFNKYVA